MQKFSNTLANLNLNSENDDDYIEEEINYEGKFENVNNLVDEDNDEFIESIIEHQTDDYKFDAFIEKLQEIVIEDEFENIQENFFTKYCNEFEEDEENKLIYMDIFKKYTKLTESYIEDNLKKRVTQFKLEEFYQLLETRKKEIDEQLYDMLLSFTDFHTFKEMMLDYKRRKGNKKGLTLTGISIQKADFKSEQNFNNNLELFNNKSK